MDVASIKKKWEQGKKDRGDLLNRWQEIAEYFLPRRANITSKGTVGRKRDKKVFDPSPQLALETYAAGLAGGIFPPSSPFFRLKLKYVDVSSLSTESQEWLRMVESILLEMILGSNISSSAYEAHISEGAFGTSVIYIGEGKNGGVYFETLDIEDVVIFDDAEGMPECVILERNYTPSQLKAIYPKLKAPKDGTTRVLQMVAKNEDYDNTKAPSKGNMPFLSVHLLDEGEGRVIAESGFYEFPFAITRVDKTHGSAYGFSPAMKALGIVKMLNKVSEMDYMAIESSLRPALLVNAAANISYLNPMPGSINYYDPTPDGAGGSPVTPFPRYEQPAIGIQKEEMMKQTIRSIFFTDVFLTLSAEDVAKVGLTATQVLTAKNERLKMLGPIVATNQREKITPLLDRVFNIALRKGIIPPAPEEIQDMELNFNAISPLINAILKAPEVESVNNAVAFAANVSPIAPTIWDNIDLDGALRLVADASGNAGRIVRGQDEVEEIRAQRAQEQQEIMNAQEQQNV